MTNWKKILGIFAAMNGVGCGVALFLQCGLGSDPTGILCDGISRSLNIQFGHASMAYNVLLIVLALLIAKQNIGIGTVVCGAFSGYFIDFYYRILEPLQLNRLDFLLKIQLHFVGQLFFVLALAILIRFRLGMNALDAILYKAEAVTKIPYTVLRMSCDVFYTMIGFLLGGVFGIGTMVSALTTGYLVRIFTKVMRSWEFGLTYN